MCPLERPQGISIVWLSDLVFYPRWTTHSSENVSRQRFWSNFRSIELEMWPLECPQGKCWRRMMVIGRPQKPTLSILCSGELNNYADYSWKNLHTTNYNATQNVNYLFLIGEKPLKKEKGKMLVTSIFSFSRYVFQGLIKGNKSLDNLKNYCSNQVKRKQR